MNHPQIRVATIVSTPFEENCYVAHQKGNEQCFVVDPGLEPDRILQCLEAEQLHPAAILNTHGHSDHIAGNGVLKERWPNCPLVIGRDEASKLADPQGNLSALFATPLVSPPADVTVEDGQVYSAAGYDLLVRNAPGHSGGHVMYLLEDLTPPLVFVGDVIFAGSIGRTDFPDGDFGQLKASIHDILFALPDETVLLSGHGPPTTVGEERRSNPFVGS